MARYPFEHDLLNQTIQACLILVPPVIRPKEVDPKFFIDFSMKAGDIWVLGQPDKTKEAYGRGMYQFFFHAMPDWMYLLSEHKADHGDSLESACKFRVANPTALPDDAEKFCLYWDKLVTGKTPEEILEIDSQIPDDDAFEDPDLKELEDM